MAAADETLSLAAGSVRSERPPVAIDRGAAIGRFVVIDRLGEGGMGVVASAFDPTLNRRVAIKVVHPERAGRGELLREAQAMAQVTHPNVVAIYQVGELAGEDIYLAMELVEGETLTAWLGARARSWHAIVRVFAQAGRGLAAAHRAGIVHGDFTPDNVMVGRDGRARVGDFGLAGGSAPDAGIAATARADQRAFGAALHVALYAAPPVVGELRELREPPRGRAPARLWRAIRRALAPDPAARFPTMDALIAALERPPMWRRPAALAIAGVAVAAGLIAFGALGAGARRAASDPCADGDQALAGAWDPTTRDVVGHVLVAAGRGFGKDVATRVVAELDRYATDWVAARRVVCERGLRADAPTPATAAVGDRRMACLRRRLASLSALTTVLRTADQRVTRHAIDAVAQLPELAACADDQALAAASPPPDDRALAARVATVRDQLARVTALHHTGKVSDARAALAPLIATIDTIAYPAVRADVHFEQGSIALVAQEAGPALSAFAAALPDAAAAHDDELVARIWTSRMRMYNMQSDLPAALAEAPARDAAIRRVGDPARLRASVLRAMAELEENTGHLADATRDNDAAVAIVRGTPGQPQLGFALATSATIAHARGELARAEQLRQDAIAALTAELGPNHPDVGVQLQNLGMSVARRGDRARATALYDQAMAICRANGLEDSTCGAGIDDNLAELANLAGDHVRALELDQRALAIEERTLGPTSTTTLATLDNIALTQLAMHRDADARVTIDLAITRWAANGTQSTMYAHALGVRADVLRHQGHVADSLPDLEHVLAIEIAAAGGEHGELVVETADRIAGTQRLLGHRPAACAAYARAQRMADATEGAEDTKADITDWLGRCAHVVAADWD